MIRSFTVAAAMLAAGAGGLCHAQSEDESGIVTWSTQQQQPQSAGEGAFWTPERMRNAQPAPMPQGVAPSAGAPEWSDAEAEQADLPNAPPTLIPGWSPNSGEPQPWPSRMELLNLDEPAADGFAESAAAMPRSYFGAPQTYGNVPTNPLKGPYGPFQRWTMQGRYDMWPRSIHGKLFFTMSGNSYVCSATVINRNVVATAGHCVSSGDGEMATNLMFCPGYNQAGALAGTGCWGVRSVTTTGRWHNGMDFDYDYACMVMAPTGSAFKGSIGDRTGWAGVAMNWPSSQPTMQFGYPAGSPFTGDSIQQVASVEWYEVDMGAGGQKSKYIGSDLTGGSSGGGWFLSWRHPSIEIADTDSSALTDPTGANNGPFLNGVNSHRRCRPPSCESPPTATKGIFWEEMGSPVFRDSSTDTQDAYDIFMTCMSGQVQ
jgi:hypothetical protein